MNRVSDRGMADEDRKPAPRKKREEADPIPEPGGGELSPCFVMMPISDPDGYAPGHFLRVYEDIFKPAIFQAGYRPVRADEDAASNLIHLSFLRQIREAPIAICDLSTRNGNVLYELGFRQAFDMPTVLVREVGTPDLFDVAPLRAYTYRPTRLYHEVLEDQARIRDAILATTQAAKKEEGVHSLVRLLELERPASRAEVQQAESDPAVQLVRAELAEMRSEIRRLAGGPRAAEEQSRPSPTITRFVITVVGADEASLARFSSYLGSVGVGQAKRELTDDGAACHVSTAGLSLTEMRKWANRGAAAAGVTISSVRERFGVQMAPSKTQGEPPSEFG